MREGVHVQDGFFARVPKPLTFIDAARSHGGDSHAVAEEKDDVFSDVRIDSAIYALEDGVHAAFLPEVWVHFGYVGV